MKKLLLASVISLAAFTSAQADQKTELVRWWSAGPMAVQQFLVGPGRDQGGHCGFFAPNAADAGWVLTVNATGTRSFMFQLNKTGSWNGGGQIDLVIDDQTFWVNTIVDGNWLRADGLNDTLLHALYNGAKLTVQQHVAAGATAWTQQFDLNGSSTAIATMNQCATAIGAPPSDLVPVVVPATPAAEPPLPDPKNLVPVTSRHAEVPLHRDTGIYHVDAIVNGSPMRFGVDSGASDVSIPKAAMARMLITGTVKDSDYLGEVTYTMGDGRDHKEPVYRLASITVGGLTVTDVRASVSDGAPLLGLSFLSKFRSWSIDNARGVLMLD